jgi:phage repressor protein C with HTH and peptisase S24 domain
MELKAMIATWIKQARTEAGLSGAALGARLALELGTERGHTRANISHWETQKHSPNLQQLLAIAKITGKSLPDEILLAMQGSAPANSNLRYGPAVQEPSLPYLGSASRVTVGQPAANVVPVKKVTLSLQAGITGFDAEQDFEDGGTIDLPRQWVEENDYVPQCLLAIKVKGESMEPLLYAGDVVVINIADTKWADQRVFALNYNGQAVIKRLSYERGDWWMISDNPRHPPLRCRAGETIAVGRVVWRAGSPRL